MEESERRLGYNSSRHSLLSGGTRALEQERETKRHLVAKHELESAEEDRRSRMFHISHRDVDAENERSHRLQTELQVERDKRMQVEIRLQKAETEALRMPNYDQKVTEWERMMREKHRELEELRKQRSLLEHQSDSSRMLEGKVVTLQALLDEETRRASMAQAKVDDLMETLAQMQKQVSILERCKGENAKYETCMVALQRDLESSATRCRCLEQAIVEKEANFKRQLDDLKAEIHTCTMERHQLQERVLVLEKYSSKQEKDFEGLVADRAKETTLSTGLREEAERQKKYMDVIRKESHSQKMQCEALQDTLESVKADLRAEQRKAEEARRVIAEHDSRQKEHTWTAQRLRESEEEIEAGAEAMERLRASSLQQICEMQEQKQWLEEEKKKCRHLQTQNEAINRELLRLHGLEELLTSKSSEVQRMTLHSTELHGKLLEIPVLEERLCTALADLIDARAQNQTREDELVKLKKQCAEKSVLEIQLSKMEEQKQWLEEEKKKCRHLQTQNEAINRELLRLHGLEELLTSKSSEVQRMTLHSTELHGKLLEIPVLEERLRTALAERQMMQASTDDAHDAKRKADRQAATSAAKVRQLEADLIDARAQNQTREDELAKLKKQCSEKSVLEIQLSEMRHALTMRTEELERARNNIEEARAKLRSADSNHHSSMRRVVELDDKLVAATQLGKQQGVMMDCTERERLRLAKDLESCTAQLDAANTLSRKYQEEIQKANDTIEDQKKRMGEVDHRFQQEIAAHRAETERVHSMEVQLSEMREQAARTVQLDGKIYILAKTAEHREEQIDTLHQTVSELRAKVKDMESDITNAHRLDARYWELKAQMQSKDQELERLEHSEYSKTKLLSECKSMLSRLQDQFRTVSANLTLEKDRRSTLEHRFLELEAVQGKKSVAPDGRLSVLESLLACRSKELEEERQESSNLRAVRQRELEKSLTESDRYEDIVRSLNQDLSMKNEVVRRLETEEARRREELEQVLKERLHSQEELQRTLTETRAEGENRVKVLGAEVEAKVNEVTNLAFTLSRVQGQMESAMERCQQVEEESRQARKRVATLEHDYGVQTVALEEMQKTADAERHTVRTMTLSLSVERQKSAEYEGLLLSAKEQIVTLENQYLLDLRTRDDQIRRLEELRGAESNRLLELEAANKTLLEDLAVHRQKAEDAVRGYRALQANRQDDTERKSAMNPFTNTFEMKLLAESEMNWDLSSRRRPPDSLLTSLESSSNQSREVENLNRRRNAELLMSPPPASSRMAGGMLFYASPPREII